jgi:hypothetical protein
MATSSAFGELTAARAKRRPMRPKPLMPTLMGPEDVDAAAMLNAVRNRCEKSACAVVEFVGHRLCSGPRDGTAQISLAAVRVVWNFSTGKARIAVCCFSSDALMSRSSNRICGPFKPNQYSEQQQERAMVHSIATNPRDYGKAFPVTAFWNERQGAGVVECPFPGYYGGSVLFLIINSTRKVSTMGSVAAFSRKSAVCSCKGAVCGNRESLRRPCCGRYQIGSATTHARVSATIALAMSDCISRRCFAVVAITTGSTCRGAGPCCSAP